MTGRRLRSVPDQPSRVVLYRRVSALMGREGDDLLSPDLQLSALRKHVAPLGLREIAVVDDIDVSGRTFSREGLDQVRQLVVDGKVDAIAVYDLSRLGRNTGEALAFLRWLKDRGVAIISTVEKIDATTPEGSFMLTQFLAMAQLYSDQIGRRWAEVIAHRARKGFHHSGIPLGYVRDQAGRLAVDPIVGPAITRAFTDYAKGETIAEITRRVSAIRGKRTAFPTVKRVLCNPVYLGKVAIWGVGRHRMPTWRDEPKYIGDGIHQPITDQATFDACIARAERDSRTVARHLAISHPLVGLVFCAHCGHAMQIHMDKRSGDVPRLLCGLGRSTKTCKGPGTPSQPKIEAAVLDEVRVYIGELRGNVGARRRALSQASQATVNVGAVKRELDAVQQAVATLVSRWVEGKVPDAAYEVNLARYQETERELNDRLREARDVSAAPPPLELANLAEVMLRQWPDLTTAERNATLRRVVKRVEVRRRRLGVREEYSQLITVDFH